VLYDSEASHLIAADSRQHDSKAGISAALSTQIRPGLFIGGDVRYLRAYSGLGLDAFAGQAVFAGPTVYYQISKGLAVIGGMEFSGLRADDLGDRST
jgi:hypothetical protein